MKSRLLLVTVLDDIYTMLQFVCPGCATFGGTGLHMLPVNTMDHSPSWDWNGDLEKPTLSPSILTSIGEGRVCHSFLKDGVFVYLSDCSHDLAGTTVEIPDLPDWLLKGSEG